MNQQHLYNVHVLAQLGLDPAARPTRLDEALALEQRFPSQTVSLRTAAAELKVHTQWIHLRRLLLLLPSDLQQKCAKGRLALSKIPALVQAAPTLKPLTWSQQSANWNRTEQSRLLSLTHDEKVQFWATVDMEGPDDCWKYGYLHLSPSRRNCWIRYGHIDAQKVAYFSSREIDPDAEGMFGGENISLWLARCTRNTEGCCNPQHLHLFESTSRRVAHGWDDIRKSLPCETCNASPDAQSWLFHLVRGVCVACFTQIGESDKRTGRLRKNDQSRDPIRARILTEQQRLSYTASCVPSEKLAAQTALLLSDVRSLRGETQVGKKYHSPDSPAIIDQFGQVIREGDQVAFAGHSSSNLVMRYMRVTLIERAGQDTIVHGISDGGKALTLSNISNLVRLSDDATKPKQKEKRKAARRPVSTHQKSRVALREFLSLGALNELARNV